MKIHAFRLTAFSLALLSCLLLFRYALLASEPTVSDTSAGISVPVLMYHQLSNDPARFSPWCVPPETLRADILYLKEQGYTFLLPSELLSALDGETPLPEKPVLLTFDDGYETALTHVLPILEELDAKATVSILGMSADLYTETEDHDLTYSCLDWAQIGQLAASGRVEIGCHSYDLHSNKARKGARILPGEDREAYRELLRADTLACAEGIERATGKKPVVYAFPYGSTCPEAEELLGEMGFRILFGCEGRVNRLTAPEKRPILLERFNRAYGVGLAKYTEAFDG